VALTVSPNVQFEARRTTLLLLRSSQMLRAQPSMRLTSESDIANSSVSEAPEIESAILLKFSY